MPKLNVIFIAMLVTGCNSFNDKVLVISGISEDIARDQMQRSYRSLNSLQYTIYYYSRDNNAIYIYGDFNYKLIRIRGDRALLSADSYSIPFDIRNRISCTRSNTCTEDDRRFCKYEFDIPRVTEEQEDSFVSYFSNRGYPLNFVTFSTDVDGDKVEIQYYSDCGYLEHDIVTARRNLEM